MLEDLENRVKQFIECNNLYLGRSKDEDRRIYEQNDTFSTVLGLIKQLKKNGAIHRGNEYFPDPVEEMVSENKWV